MLQLRRLLRHPGTARHDREGDVGTGDVQLSSLSGSVDATSNIGSVSADGLSSATASLTSNLGDVTAVFAVAPLTVHATASRGDVTIRVPGSVSYRVTIPAAGLGTSQVSVPGPPRRVASSTLRATRETSWSHRADAPAGQSIGR
jgi:hypothetical protein